MKKRILIAITIIVLILLGIGIFLIIPKPDEVKPTIHNGEKVYDGTEIEEEYAKKQREEGEKLKELDEKKEANKNNNASTQDENKIYPLTGQAYGFGDDGSQYFIYLNGETIELYVPNQELMDTLSQFEFEEMISVTYRVEKGVNVLVEVKNI